MGQPTKKQTAESVTESVKALAQLYPDAEAKIAALMKGHDEPSPEPEPEPEPERKLLLEDAIRIVCADRNHAYGEPLRNLSRTADLLNAFLRGRTPPFKAQRDFTADDVAAIGIILKLARLAPSPDLRDTWEDIAGYAAIGWECAEARLDAGGP